MPSRFLRYRLANPQKSKRPDFLEQFFLWLPELCFSRWFIFIELLALSWLIPGVLLKVLFLLSLPFAGKLAFNWYILFRKFMGRSRLFLLRVFYKKDFRTLVQQHETLFKQLDELISD
jgi:hypothetical protein